MFVFLAILGLTFLFLLLLTTGGLRGGVIVKYNLNSDGPVLFNDVLGVDVQNPVMRGKQLDTEERKSKSRLAASGSAKRPLSEREFFQAHRDEIEFISKIGTSKDTHDPASKFISVDKTGRIMVWPYAKESYSGFGWFIPSAKYKLRQRYEGKDFFGFVWIFWKVGWWGGGILFVACCCCWAGKD